MHDMPDGAESTKSRYEIYGEQYFTNMEIFNEIKIQFQLKMAYNWIQAILWCIIV